MLRWADRHWVLARLTFAAVAVVIGVVLVEVVGVDSVEPGQWAGHPLGAFVTYGMVGLVGGFVLSFFAGSTWVLLAMIWLGLRWAIAVPGRVYRSARRIGARGVAGHGLLATYGLVIAGVLVALGGFRYEGVEFWTDLFFNTVIVVLFGGAIGAMALVIVATWLRVIFARRLPSPADHWPTLRILLPVGFVLGAGALWAWWGPVDLAYQASVVGLDWVTVPIAFAVIHGYALLAYVLYKAVHAVRVRARLLSQPVPEALVWHEGGTIPSRPREVHWSPDAVIGWRGWNISGGHLIGHFEQPWESSVLAATCKRGHPQPEWLCNCGIYACKDPAKVHGLVVGRVAMEGVVIEHEHGYRAERARIVELWTADPDIADWLGQNYPDVAVRSSRPAQGLA